MEYAIAVPLFLQCFCCWVSHRLRRRPLLRRQMREVPRTPAWAVTDLSINSLPRPPTMPCRAVKKRVLTAMCPISRRTFQSAAIATSRIRCPWLRRKGCRKRIRIFATHATTREGSSAEPVISEGSPYRVGENRNLSFPACHSSEIIRTRLGSGLIKVF